MRVKEANILDFLSVPQKVSSTVYELMAKEATDAYAGSKTDPNQTIAKIASEKGLNPDQIHRVVELTNHSINTSLSKEADDQLFTFPTSTVEGVLAAMGMGSAKTASVEIEDAPYDGGAYSRIRDLPDYVDTVAARKFSRSMSVPGAQKVASEETEAAPPEVLAKIASEDLKRARGEAEYAETNVRAALAAVKSDWSKVAECDREEYLYGAAHVLGIDDARSLAAVLGPEAEKVAAVLDSTVLRKLASFVEDENELLGRITVLKSQTEAYSSAVEKVAFLRGAVAAASKAAAPALGYATKNPLRKAVFAAGAGAAGAEVANKKLGLPVSKMQGIKSAVGMALPVPAPIRAFNKIRQSAEAYK